MKSHPAYEAPSDTGMTIWRYMSLAKFVSMLETRALFFARADKLGDPFEGSYPQASQAKLGPKVSGTNADGTSWEMGADAWDQLSELRRAMVRWTAISCWYGDPNESAALWAMFAHEGVAIRSTFARLTESISREDVGYGLVKYIDYSTAQIMATTALHPFTYKRKSFEHEREVRAVITVYPEQRQGKMWTGDESMVDGLVVPTDIDHLIVETRVSPLAPTWFLDVVAATARKWDVTFPVNQSALSGSPLY